MHWTHFALLAVCAFAVWTDYAMGRLKGGIPPITRVALVFLANSAFLTLWALLVDPYINPVLQVVVDIMCAYAVMRDPADREQGWIGLFFGFRIGASWAFLQSGVPEASGDYWQLMNTVAQLMMVALVLWSESNGGQLSRFVRWVGRAVLGRVSVSHTNSAVEK